MHLGEVSIPERLQVPAEDGSIVHAVYYPPTKHAVTGSPGQRPPLIVQPRPGPTSHAPVRLELRTQFFTSRGFAVVDVDHRGSIGYGRVGPWPEAARAASIQRVLEAELAFYRTGEHTGGAEPEFSSG